jgi:hypothetical protein
MGEKTSNALLPREWQSPREPDFRLPSKLTYIKTEVWTLGNWGLSGKEGR